MLDLNDVTLFFDAAVEDMLPIEIIGPSNGWLAEDMGCENINYIAFYDEDIYVDFQPVKTEYLEDDEVLGSQVLYDLAL